MHLIRSLDSIQIMILVAFVLAPAIAPLWTWKRNAREGRLTSAIWVAVAKVLLAMIVATLLTSPFTAWIARLVGGLISPGLLVAVFVGLAIFVLAGFWSAGDDGWRVMKWAAIGVALFLFSTSLKLHPFEIAKQIESAFGDASDDSSE